MSIKRARQAEAGDSVNSRKPRVSTLPSRATAETIPRFQMRTKRGALITVPRVSAHVEIIAQQQRRRSVLDFRNTPAATGETHNAKG